MHISISLYFSRLKLNVAVLLLPWGKNSWLVHPQSGPPDQNFLIGAQWLGLKQVENLKTDLGRCWFWFSSSSYVTVTNIKIWKIASFSVILFNYFLCWFFTPIISLIIFKSRIGIIWCFKRVWLLTKENVNMFDFMNSFIYIHIYI